MNMTLSASRASLVAALFLAVAFAGCSSNDKGPNDAPKADLQITQDSPNVFTLDGSKSTDPDGDHLTYFWNWVLKNATTHEPKIQVEFPDAVAKGNAGFVASLVVRDPAGKSSVAFGAIQFGTGTDNIPVVGIVETARWVKPNTEIVLDASVSTDKDGDALSYEWLWGPRGSFVPNAPGVANACDENDTRLATFSTGCLNEGQSFKLTFSEVGTWEIHCHPHPWMTGRIVVDDSLPAADTTLDIANFGYDIPVLHIGKGSTVTFVNKDSVPHTATVLYWLPGTKEGGTNPVFKVTPPEGEYVARVVVKDGKGGTATMSYGLKVSADAPPNPYAKQWNSTAPLLPKEANQAWRQGYYNMSFDGLLTAVLTIPDQTTTGTVTGNFTVGRVDPDGAFTSQSQCVAKKEPALGSEPPQMKMTCVLKKDNYLFRVTSGGANPSVVPSWTLSASSQMRTKPPFGDSVVGVCHAGHCH